MREHPQTVDEIRAPSVDDDLGIGGQRIGVHRGHEDRARTRTRRGHLAERARAHCGPQAGGHQGRFDRHGVEIAEFFRRLRIEGDLVVCVRIGLEPDHDRLKNTLGAAIDRNHLAGTRRGIAHARRLLVLEQRLAQLDEIAFGDKHRGLHAMVVDTDYRHPTDRWRVVNDLAWRAADRQIQTFSDRDSHVAAGAPRVADNLDGADGRTRTGTALATAPSRQRVYQFHHVGMNIYKPVASLFGNLSAGIGLVGAVAAGR